MENARSFVYHGATVVGDEALSVDAEVACRMAKVSADDVMVYAGDRSVQFHGGFGFTWSVIRRSSSVRPNGRSRCTVVRCTIANVSLRCCWITARRALRCCPALARASSIDYCGGRCVARKRAILPPITAYVRLR